MGYILQILEAEGGCLGSKNQKCTKFVPFMADWVTSSDFCACTGTEMVLVVSVSAHWYIISHTNTHRNTIATVNTVAFIPHCCINTTSNSNAMLHHNSAAQVATAATKGHGLRVSTQVI